jgi:hypothetical protein
MISRILRPLVGVFVTAIGLVAVPSLTAHSAPEPTVSTSESGCTEQAFTRSLIRDAVDPLVPDEFELTPTFTPVGSPARVAGLINVVTCTQVTVSGPAAAYFAQHPTMTTFIYSASLLDGTGYALLYATDNPVLAARYRQLGWPVQLLSPRTNLSLVDPADAPQQAAWSLKGPGWDGLVESSVPSTLNPVESSTFELVHQSGDTLLHLCYANLASVTPNTVWFDLSQTPVADFAALAVLPTDPVKIQFPGWRIKGGWTATLTSQACSV